MGLHLVIMHLLFFCRKEYTKTHKRASLKKYRTVLAALSTKDIFSQFNRGIQREVQGVFSLA